MHIKNFLAQFPIPNFGINLFDIVFVVVILFYAYEGYSLGLALASLDLVSFVLSFIIALKFYNVLANLLLLLFSLPLGFAHAIGFFLLAFVAEVCLGLFFRGILRRVPTVRSQHPLFSLLRKLDHWLGIIPGMVSAFIVLSFLLTIVVSLPSSPLIKSLVTDSKIGSRLIANTSLFEKQLNSIFGGALNDTLNFLTVEPKSNESVNLHFSMKKGTVDDQAEQEMFILVNKERVKSGLAPLTFDTMLRDVARAHSQDMFARGYFSHYTPEGRSPFDRMTNAGITFMYAGENLALAPSTDLAMQGLMNSPGHRANILNPNFKKIGIGVIDGGIYGKMYSQEFTD